MGKSAGKAKVGANTDGVVDADTNPDEVMSALGLEDEPDDEQDDDDTDDDAEDGDDDGDDDEDDDDEDPLEALRAELREQKRTIARLTREAAAARVKGKSKASEGGAAGGGSDDGETVEQALERGKAEARLELGLERAGDMIRSALTGIVPEADLDDFVDDLRLERYIDDEGKPDRDAIKALKTRQAKITRRRTSNAGHARQGSGGVAKKSKADEMADTLTALGL